MSTFSEKIREARKAAGYTQNETADALGISMFAYLALDRGETPPDNRGVERPVQAL